VADYLEHKLIKFIY